MSANAYRTSASEYFTQRCDKSPALLVICVDLDPAFLPDAVDVIGVAVDESLDGRTVLGLDDEQAADRRLVVVGHERPRRDHLDAVALAVVEVLPVRLVMLGAGVDRILLIHGM